VNQQEVQLKIPDGLTELDQWVLWRQEDGTKVPYHPTGRKASTTRSCDWSDYDLICRTWQRYLHRYAGVGFVFTESDPFCGIDLDNCLDRAGAPERWAWGVIERFADCYMEVSPSGKGIKIFTKGKLPSGLGQISIQDGGIEMYDRARYFTVTGRVFRGAPLQIEDHASDVMALYKHLTARRAGPTREIPEKIPVGARHNTLISLCGTLRRRGVCAAAIEACLNTVNRYQCEQPEPAENISRIVNSTRDWSVE
jgi:primase-polymerase (primpol)-like protein